jgi:outer membrane protein OmpA-like peptidoglycan-associated protein
LGNDLLAQAPTGEFTDYKVTPDKDTLVYFRKMGDWWFGATGGANFNFDFNQISLPANPRRAQDITNPLIDYTSKVGAGTFLGLTGEWIPTGGFWAGKINVLLMDSRRTFAETDKYYREFADTLPTDTSIAKSFTLNTTFKYITVSPSVRYNFKIQGLHAFGGMDFEIFSSDIGKITKRFQNSADIKELGNWQFSDVKTRLGMHLGLGYDMFVADMNHRVRINFTPFLSVHAGTGILKDNGSSLNTVLVRLGLSVKFGPDQVQYDTIIYNPAYTPPPIMLARLERKYQVSFSTFQSQEIIIPIELAFIEKPKIAELLALEPTIREELSFKQEIIREQDKMADLILMEKAKIEGKKDLVAQKIDLIPNVKKSLSFATSSSVKLNKEMTDYLDNVAEYLIANPKHRLGIIGHSDDQGNMNENTDRAQKRADEAVNYLVRKGISKSRLFAYGRGSLDPIAQNTTKAGQKRNRRVDIEIIPPNKKMPTAPGGGIQGDKSGKKKPLPKPK